MTARPIMPKSERVAVPLNGALRARAASRPRVMSGIRTATTGRAPSVMVVEDDESLREVIAESLHAEGYRVLLAGNGQEALALLAAPPQPSLVVCDLRMPVMDGWQLLAALGEDAALRGVPVLVISSESTVEHTGKRFLRKPFCSDRLLAAVRDLLR